MLMEDLETITAPSDTEFVAGVAVGLLVVALAFPIFC
jgi:hypothetical protein